MRTYKMKGYTFTSEELSYADLEYGLSLQTIRMRIQRGWTREDALNTPERHYTTQDIENSVEEALKTIGRMKYLNRVNDDIYYPEKWMNKLGITWDDVEEVAC